MRMLKVLMCDDDAAIRRVAAITLTQLAEWTVEVAASGREAIEVLKSFRPDVILMDVMMPNMDGPSTVKLLQENPALASIPVIFMTAKVQGSETASYPIAGAAGVIAKPFDPLTLPQEIEAIVDRKCRKVVLTKV